jgi:hypothetical protein
VKSENERVNQGGEYVDVGNIVKGKEIIVEALWLLPYCC